MLVECFKEHPESFWQKRKKPAYPWDEKTFLDAIENCYFTPQADPNTASQTQRLMKVLALKQLVASNPTLYDPIAVDTAALQALGWSNPQQFMIPMSAHGKPPPEMLQMMAKAKNDELVAQARMMDSQTRAKESEAKIQIEIAKLQAEQDDKVNQVDPMKMEQLRTQQMEIQQRQEDAMIDAVNRKRDRESRERLATVKLAEDLIQNPQGLGIVNTIIDPAMIERLETNEPTLDGRQTGEL